MQMNITGTTQGWSQGGCTTPTLQLMTHRIHIKLQLTGKSRLIFNSISSSAIGRYGVVRDLRVVIEA